MWIFFSLILQTIFFSNIENLDLKIKLLWLFRTKSSTLQSSEIQGLDQMYIKELILAFLNEKVKRIELELELENARIEELFFFLFIFRISEVYLFEINNLIKKI